MTVEDAPAPTRRSLRARPLDPDGGPTTTSPEAVPVVPVAVTSDAQTPISVAMSAFDAGPVAGAVPTTRPALAWVDASRISHRAAPADFATATSSYTTVGPDLLAHAPRRSLLRPGVLWPSSIGAVVVGAYAATTLLWPLHAVAPTITPAPLTALAAPAAEMVWPAQGSGSVAVAGMDAALASTDAAAPMASITKVVTALLVLDQMPLALGEAGEEFWFTAADSAEYWQYRARDESALDVPVDGMLTEYQMLEGMLVGSANNYADRLASRLWPSDAVFADAAQTYLHRHGLPGITVVEPTGIDPGNAADPAALMRLAAHALANPVIAEIVAKREIDLPGAGRVENTNALLADPGVVGIKTGTLFESWNLLSAKDVQIGDTAVRVYASVLGQPDGEGRDAASRALFDQVEVDLQPTPSIAAGTVAGAVSTLWGSQADILVADDASVVLWDGRTASVDASYDLDDSRDAGDPVGDLTVSGPLDTDDVALELAADIDDPSPWWRLTHPLDLFGLTG